MILSQLITLAAAAAAAAAVRLAARCQRNVTPRNPRQILSVEMRLARCNIFSCFLVSHLTQSAPTTLLPSLSISAARRRRTHLGGPLLTSPPTLVSQPRSPTRQLAREDKRPPPRHYIKYGLAILSSSPSRYLLSPSTWRKSAKATFLAL